MNAFNLGRRSSAVLAAAAAAPLIFLAGCAAPGGDVEPTNSTDDNATCAYPDRDIEFVVPYSSGGGFDTWARVIAPVLQDKLPGGVAVPVINRPGAGGITGVTEVFSSGTEGRQIVISEPGILATGGLAGTTDLDFESMEAVGRVTVGPEVIVVAANSPWQTIQDVQAEAQNRTLKMATGGLAAINIVSFEELGLPFDNIIHEGSSEALLSIVRGDTDISVYPLSSVAEGIRGGDLRPLVVVGSMPGSENPDADVIQGVTLLDDVVGKPGLGAALEQHRMILTAPGTDQCIIDTLSDALGEVFADSTFLGRLDTAGLVPAYLTAEDAQAVFENTFTQLAEYQDILIANLEG